MNYTSIEQSKKLLSLGLSPKSADMFWMLDSKDYYEVVAVPYSESVTDNDDGIPCWSVGALWQLMPNIRTEHGIMRPKSVKENSKQFPFRYYYETLHYTDMCSTPIEAAYNMVVWLLENGYIKTENNDV